MTDWRLYDRYEMSGDEDDPQPNTPPHNAATHTKMKTEDPKPDEKKTVETGIKGNVKNLQTKNGKGGNDGDTSQEKRIADEAKLRELVEKATKAELRQTVVYMSLIAGVFLVVFLVAGLFLQFEISKIQTDLETINAKLETLKTSASSKDYSLYVQNTDYNKDKNETKTKLEKEINEYRSNTARTIQEIERQWQSHLQSKLDGVVAGNRIEDMQPLKSELEEFKDDFKNFKDTTTSDVSTLKNSNNDLTDSLRTVQSSVHTTATDLKGEIAAAKTQIQDELVAAKQNMDNDIKKMEQEHEQNIKQAKEALDARYDSLGEEVSKSKVVVEEVLLPNAFNKEAVLQAFLLLALLGIALVFFYLRRPSGPQGAPHYGNHDGSGSSADKSNEPVSQAVARIPLGQPLQNAICAISFDKNTQSLHQKLMEQVLEGQPDELTRKTRTQYRTVLQHEDITSLPATKLYIMFVDYSERHVIIEQPGLGLGDTRRTTVQALERFGGELVMIYMHDLASRRLPTGRRYNRDIYCVKSQPKLKTLNNQGRFYSVYETLTDFQRQSLQSTIDDVFSE